MTEGQLGNIAQRAQQCNLLGERRKSEGEWGEFKKEREKKEEKGGKREKEGVEKRTEKRDIKNRKAKMNRCMLKRFMYIQEELQPVKKSSWIC